MTREFTPNPAGVAERASARMAAAWLAGRGSEIPEPPDAPVYMGAEAAWGYACGWSVGYEAAVRDAARPDDPTAEPIPADHGPEVLTVDDSAFDDAGNEWLTDRHDRDKFEGRP